MTCQLKVIYIVLQWAFTNMIYFSQLNNEATKEKIIISMLSVDPWSSKSGRDLSHTTYTWVKTEHVFRYCFKYISPMPYLILINSLIVSYSKTIIWEKGGKDKTS